ncbi:GNAT family N-acetyltransferase [Georgenia sp. TF02-10]|uniref:GNAT family N-acetyltransferase n=1 Tax=Georgenia sp. TF02-10 TaxID=2917725 RepID=UPI001FA7FEDF|nr:GNAT family N-acetyltransferase [Georgenia sp. TF02-10]UNX55452.1 GNAT family N-acetyltransferase [Georgenia sp. TF02-10]
MSTGVWIDQIGIDLDAGTQQVDEAIVVMHSAFVEYGHQGQASGAMVETADSLRAELSTGTRLGLARIGGQAVAMVKYRTADGGTLYFGRLAVSPEARGRGLASALVRALRGAARDMGLGGLSCSVRAAETRNIMIYEHLGMAIIGREDRRSLTGAVIPVVLMRDV